VNGEKRKRKEMVLIIRDLAKRQMSRTAKWVEEENTEGAGHRWLTKLQNTLDHKALVGVKHAICKSKGMSRYGYRCFTYNEKWVVAYRIEGDNFIICRFVYGAKIV
jgi:hypothetical protein